MPDARSAFCQLTESEALSRLQSVPEGLSEAEAAERLARDGLNQIEREERAPAWLMFLNQFNDVLIWVLLGAVLISAVQGEWIDAIAITVILFLNAVLGFVQEYRAEQALDALKQLSAPTATVFRGGVEREIPAEELVAGDVVGLEAGDKIPADGRLLEAAALRVVEAALTGESAPSRKDTAVIEGATIALGDQTCMVFAGTAVAVGRGRFVVTATGDHTEMGKIADLLAAQSDEMTPLQKELAVVGKRIALLVLVIAAIVFAEEIALLFSRLKGGFREVLQQPAFQEGATAALLIAVSLAVAAIPEGLPAIVTIALSLGVRRMATHNAIVRRLHAVETLGSTTFICSDKTGTLTRNVMTVRKMLVGLDEADVLQDWGIEPAAESPAREDLSVLLDIAADANDAHYTAAGELVGDPTETALIEAASHLAPGHLHFKRVGEVPFDSERKRMTTVHAKPDTSTRIAYMKGGPDVVLALCTSALLRGQTVPMTDALRAEISERNAAFAAGGYRTLGFAYRNLAEEEPSEGEALERDLTYVGIMGLQDPARPEVPEAIAQAQRAGITVAMVTGDHALTARAIGEQIGLLAPDAPDTALVTGADLEDMSDDELAARAEEIRVYARVNPEHKLRIVDALRRDGEIVAMTGDGVNDAPALKKADIGVAMGQVGTDVSREAADMVLADDNFATIVEAVHEGRVVFDNLRKVVLFLLSCNMSEVLVVFVSALVSPQAALIPLQLLWINLVTDGLPALALGVDPADPGVMDRSPRSSNESILTFRNQMQIVWQGAVMTATTLGLGWFAAQILGESASADRTMVFTALVLTQLLHAFNFRSATGSVFHLRSLSNRWLVLGLIGSMALQCVVVYWPAAQRIFETSPLGPIEWLAIVGTALLSVGIMDVTKLVIARIRRREA
ncbi:MAG: calcium-translocating P-type ATPase, PMCA-type [Coriobacteriales bacterium]|nr:calcium-translocating P-type ATPase, PMCA-type [Coriobacteriales bacterium]